MLVAFIMSLPFQLQTNWKTILSFFCMKIYSFNHAFIYAAQELQDAQCGETTTGKKVPDFCPSTNTGCRIAGGGPARPGQQPWQVR